MRIEIRIGDCRQLLAAMADESVDCVVCSPPYWGLRDYGVAGQIGNEPTLMDHIAVLVDVFREVRRVLRKDGTLWLNYGDCYAGSWGGQGYVGDPGAWAGAKLEAAPKGRKRTGSISRTPGLKPKDLCMMGARLAIALCDDGWYLRSEIVWAKPNPMPESIRDRPTSAHEKLFLFAKSDKYYYDADAVAEPVTQTTIARVSQPTHETQAGSWRQPGKINGPMKAVVKKSGNLARKSPADVGRPESGSNLGRSVPWEGTTRNLRNVWTIATAAFSEAHFATFPPALIEPCIKAGTSEMGNCPHCRAQWKRTVHSEFVPQGDVDVDKGVRGSGSQKPMDESNGWQGVPRGTTKRETRGWLPSCDCADNVPVPAVVLDPFGGSGTTGMVAARLQRNAILFELNPEYAAMAMRRCRDDGGMLLDITVAA